MATLGFEVARYLATPREDILKGLGEHPPLPREPIILEPNEGNVVKAAKSTDKKSTE